ncbi:MAG: hypothetical protein AAFV38_13855, partial [Pseudomonadota bacterium]
MPIPFHRRIARCPIPFDRTVTADISARFEHHARETRELLAGTSGCSPFLRRLVEKEASWLDQALSRDPDD